MLTFLQKKFIINIVTIQKKQKKGEKSMKFKVTAKAEGFTVELAETKSDKRLEIKNLELEEPFLLTADSIISEIKNRTREYFNCEDVELLPPDNEVDNKACRIMLSNKQSFESN